MGTDKKTLSEDQSVISSYAPELEIRTIERVVRVP
jgi:hypothetical protein